MRKAHFSLSSPTTATSFTRGESSLTQFFILTGWSKDCSCKICRASSPVRVSRSRQTSRSLWLLLWYRAAISWTSFVLKRKFACCSCPPSRARRPFSRHSGGLWKALERHGRTLRITFSWLPGFLTRRKTSDSLCSKRH